MKLTKGDVIIVSGLPFMIIDHWDEAEKFTDRKNKFCLLCLKTFDTDVWMEDAEFSVGDVVWEGVERDGSDSMKVDAIIPRNKVKIGFNF